MKLRIWGKNEPASGDASNTCLFFLGWRDKKGEKYILRDDLTCGWLQSTSPSLGPTALYLAHHYVRYHVSEISKVEQSVKYLNTRSWFRRARILSIRRDGVNFFTIWWSWKECFNGCNGSLVMDCRCRSREGNMLTCPRAPADTSKAPTVPGGRKLRYVNTEHCMMWESGDIDYITLRFIIIMKRES
ncbi:hypothetical protein QTP88_023096 [Uroleucon formosanum]